MRLIKKLPPVRQRHNIFTCQYANTASRSNRATAGKPLAAIQLSKWFSIPCAMRVLALPYATFAVQPFAAYHVVVAYSCSGGSKESLRRFVLLRCATHLSEIRFTDDCDVVILTIRIFLYIPVRRASAGHERRFESIDTGSLGICMLHGVKHRCRGNMQGLSPPSGWMECSRYPSLLLAQPCAQCNGVS